MQVRTTVDDLISEALSYDNTPNAQNTFSPNQVARFCDQEMRSAVVPATVKLMEEFFVTTEYVDVGVDNNRVTIRGDAAGFRLRDVYLIPTNNSNGSNNMIKAVRVNPDQLPYLQNSTQFGVWGGRGPTFIIENNVIVFYPALTQPYTARVRYMKAPNHLAPYLTCTAQITGIDLVNNILTVTNIPTGTSDIATTSPWLLTTGINAATLDFYTPDSPYNFRVIGDSVSPLIDRAIIAVDTGAQAVTVDAETAANVQVGDFVSTHGYFGLVQYLPFEAYNLITLRASMRILKAQGDLQNLGVSAQYFNSALDDYTNLLTPKVENAQAKVSNFDSPLGRGSWNGTWSR